MTMTRSARLERKIEVLEAKTAGTGGVERNRNLELGLLFAVGSYAGAMAGKSLREKLDERDSKKSGARRGRRGLLQGIHGAAARLRRRKTSTKP